MWEQFKRKVTNLIYEEIDEEKENSEEEKLTNSSDKPSTKQHRDLRRKHKNDVKTKVTFEYPKRQSSFRFPVIPDEEEGTSRSTVRPSIHYQKRKVINDGAQPAFERRQERRRPRVRHQTQRQVRSVYEQKKLVDELENIPAFERRQRIVDKESFSEKEVPKLGKEDIDRSKIPYSKPEELDAVFKKKDRPKKKIEESPDLVTKASPIQVEQDEKGDFQASFSSAEKTDSEQKRKTPDGGVLQTHLVKRDQKNNQLDLPELSKSVSISKEKDMKKQSPTIELPYHLLDDIEREASNDQEWLEEQKFLLQQTLEHFNIDAEIVAVTQGPTVTRIEIQPALGVKVSRIRNLQDDIKLNLAARDIRIEAPIPGKHTVGIEIPNKESETVYLQEMLEREAFKEETSPLTVALGLTIEGEPYYTNISEMPHGLIAGATGSGKSVCINTIILSLLYKAHYDEVKLMLIDPKMVELTQYNGIPHLVTPVITDAKAATAALKWAVDEMERRYELFVKNQVRDIKRYNRTATEDSLPYIVIIIDELADLMLVSPQEVEDYISRIAQKARAAGIHLLLATQRPSVDVITGLIKANIPSRIAFSVSSQVDSRTILDEKGAEQLLGKGDMLLIENGSAKPLRLQGPFVSDEEIERVVHYLRSLSQPTYLFEHEELFLQLELEEQDELFDEAVQFVIDEQRASTSLLQRRFRIGYNRAARLIDAMYDSGIISASKGSRPRDVLVTPSQWEKNKYS